MEDLHRLESVLTAAGSPLPELLAPGLAPDEVQASLAEIGMQAPAQLLTWWSWQNGLQPGAKGLLLLWEPLSLAEAIKKWHWVMGVLTRGGVFADDPDYGAWRPTWLPILNSGGMSHFAADCSPGQDTDCRIAMVSPDAGLFNDPTLPNRQWTLRDAVQWWTRLIDDGCYFFPTNDNPFNAWEIDFSRIPRSEANPNLPDPRWGYL